MPEEERPLLPLVEGSCYSCGYLCKKPHVEGYPMPEFFELQGYERAAGNADSHRSLLGNVQLGTIPACFWGWPRLPKRYLRTISGPMFKSVIGRRFGCLPRTENVLSGLSTGPGSVLRNTCSVMKCFK